MKATLPFLLLFTAFIARAQEPTVSYELCTELTGRVNVDTMILYGYMKPEAVEMNLVSKGWSYDTVIYDAGRNRQIYYTYQYALPSGSMVQSLLILSSRNGHYDAYYEFSLGCTLPMLMAPYSDRLLTLSFQPKTIHLPDRMIIEYTRLVASFALQQPKQGPLKFVAEYRPVRND